MSQVRSVVATGGVTPRRYIAPIAGKMTGRERKVVVGWRKTSRPWVLKEGEKGNGDDRKKLYVALEARIPVPVAP